MVARVLEQVSEQAGAPDQARKFAPSNLMLVLDDVWRTFKPHGPDSDDYQRVLLDKPGPDGKILSGLGGKYNGKTISELVRSQEEPDEDTDEYGDEDEYVAPTTAPSSYELAPSEMMVNQAEPSSSSALAQLVARVNQTAPDIVNTSVSAYLPAEPTPIWPLKFPDIDEVMVEACVLPDKSIIDDLDEDELNYFKDLYRSQRQILEAKCTRNELRALFLGPAKFAKSDLKDTPHLEINSPEAQEAYNRLEAEMLAARAIRKLRSAGILHPPADKLQQIKQLEMQLKQARQSYCEYSQPVTADILRENFEAAHQGLAYPEEQHFQEQCDQALTQALKQQYQSGKLLSFPWICRVFMQPDFTCSNAYIETWLDAAKLQALLTNGISGKAICQRLGSKKYKALLETTEQQLKQAQQMLELHEGCSLRKALDREFSRYCHQQIPLLRQHDIKPEALCNTLAGPNMSFKQADHKRPNPHYDTQIPGVKPSKSPYRHNCPLCAVAYEVRRRGFNIEAGPYFEDLDAIKLANSIKELDPMALLSLYSQLIWHNPNTEASPDVTYFAELSPRLNHANMAQIAEVKLNKLLQPNQRFHLAFQWAAGGGHIVTVEKSAHGQLIIYDPQSGQNYSVAEYFSPQHNPKAKSIRLTSLRTYRVDNCEISTDFANYILTQAGTPTVKTAYNLTNDWEHHHGGI